MTASMSDPVASASGDRPAAGVQGGVPVDAAAHTRAGRPPGTSDRSVALTWGALAIVYVVWGSTYFAILLTVRTLPPILSGGARFVLAGALLAAVIALRRGIAALRVTMRQLAGAGFTGVLLLFGGNGLVVIAESGPPGRAVPSSIAALLIATVPLLVVLLRAVTGDRPGRGTLLGVPVGFAGLAALILSRGGDGDGGGGLVPVPGALLVLGAAASWSLGSFLASRLTLPADPFVAAVYQMLAGGAVMAAVGTVRGEAPRFADGSAQSWLALGYLLVAGSLVAFTAYAWLLRHAPISLTSTYAYVNPVVAVALGAGFAGEKITLPVLASGAVIVAGVALVVSAERSAARSAAAAAAARSVG